MTTLLDYLRSSAEGSAALSVTRLRDNVALALQVACRAAGDGDEAAGADKLAGASRFRRRRLRRALAGDGDLGTAELAKYLNTAGFELSVDLLPLATADELAAGPEQTDFNGQIALDLPRRQSANRRCARACGGSADQTSQDSQSTTGVTPASRVAGRGTES